MLLRRILPARATSPLVLTALLLGLEILAITLLVDTGDLHAGGFAGWAARLAPSALRLFCLTAVLTWVFAGLGAEGSLTAPSGPSFGLSRLAFATHIAFATVTCVATVRLLSGGASASLDSLAVAALLSALACVVSGCLVFVPPAFWSRLLRRSPWALPAALAAAGIALLAASSTKFFVSGPWLQATFDVASAILRQFDPQLVIRPDRFLIASRTFEIEIAPACSGYEGAALMLVFAIAWLVLFRREFRFPQALLLIPAGVAGMWSLNCVRIVALFLIGNAGAPGIAQGGFHSQAGWISFIGMALAFSIAGQRVPWIAVPRPNAPRVQAAPGDRTAAYLLPFLSILAAGMIAQAVSSGFEWAYPLRVMAAAAVLWRFRRCYDGLSWRIGPAALAAGALVGGVWIAAELLFDSASTPLAAPSAWAGAPPLARWGWLATRIAGGVLTVPIAEEFAFRGYALRRLVAADFVNVDPRHFTWLAFGLSSLLFGLLHGKRWMVGAVAGMVFAGAWRRRGSMGDAVAAHAAANLVLAVWAAVSGDWRFW